MTFKEYDKLEKKFQELFREKCKLEMELEKVSAEFLYVQHRLNNEPITE